MIENIGIGGMARKKKKSWRDARVEI